MNEIETISIDLNGDQYAMFEKCFLSPMQENSQ